MKAIIIVILLLPGCMTVVKRQIVLPENIEINFIWEEADRWDEDIEVK